MFAGLQWTTAWAQLSLSPKTSAVASTSMADFILVKLPLAHVINVGPSAVAGELKAVISSNATKMASMKQAAAAAAL